MGKVGSGGQYGSVRRGAVRYGVLQGKLWKRPGNPLNFVYSKLSILSLRAHHFGVRGLACT